MIPVRLSAGAGCACLTRESVHYGQTQQVLGNRRRILLDAYAETPERFVAKVPAPKPLQPAVWINPPHSTRVRSRYS